MYHHKWYLLWNVLVCTVLEDYLVATRRTCLLLEWNFSYLNTEIESFFYLILHAISNHFSNSLEKTKSIKLFKVVSKGNRLIKFVLLRGTIA